MTQTLVRIDRDDPQQFADLRRYYLRQQMGQRSLTGRFIFPCMPGQVQAYRDLLAARTATYGDAFNTWFILNAAGQRKGFLQAKAWTKAFGSETAFFDHIYLDHDARGTGLAAGAILEAEQAVVRQGAINGLLMVAHQNVGARRLYERLGWAATEVNFRPLPNNMFMSKVLVPSVGGAA